MAAACASTHDLATLKGFWNGIDLDTRRDLGLHQSPDEYTQARDQRRHDKWRLLQALANEALLPEKIDIDRLDDVEFTDELASAIHAYLARSSACLLLVQLDDLAGEERQVNLPGTSSQYPNWRRRLTESLEAIATDPAIAATLRRISIERENSFRS
jgi:4-alpha-glucanotransferase